MQSKRTQFWLEVLLVLLVFFIQGAWPVPDTNEAHYLLKATSFWNPDFCQGDFFLESADAHLTFYLSFGWLTLFFSPEVVIWLGRIITWALLAWGWCRLSRAVLPVNWIAILTAAVWVALIDWFSMAGEWVVGGLEAKGIAYVFVFLGIEAIIRNRWNRVWIFFGAGAMFHVIVGGWAVVAGMVAWFILREESPPIRKMLPGLIAGGLLSLPGLLPVLALSRGVDPSLVDMANRVYVYLRLPHHLNFASFSSAFVFRFGILMLVWVFIRWMTSPKHPVWRIHAFVTGTVLICMIGVIITYLTRLNPTVGAALLRFYWFRLADCMVPLGAALGGIALVVSLRHRVELYRGLIALLIVAAGVHLFALGLNRVAPVPPRSYLMPWWNYRQWTDACQWIDRSGNIPEDARFMTPRFGADFKWYAHRSDLVNWKDVPQDPKSIALWWQQILLLHAYGMNESGPLWFDSLARQGTPRILWLADHFGADYLITATEPRLPLPIEYENDGYIVYRLKKRPTKQSLPTQ
jgi:Domain of unknown function (DUF6798)